MEAAISTVKTGEITYAVRDTTIDGYPIKKGDLMGIGDEGILAVGADVRTVALEMLGKMVDDESGLVSIYNGADFGEEETEELTAAVEEAFPDVDVEANFGGQPIYYCILSVE